MDEKTPIKQFLWLLQNGDMSMVAVVFGFGLIMWATLGVAVYPGDLWDYTSMFRVGSIWYWAINHWFVGGLLFAAAAMQFPTRLSQFTGAWLVVAWSWSTFARMTEVTTLQTGAAVSGLYVIIGALILHRSTRRHCA